MNRCPNHESGCLISFGWIHFCRCYCILHDDNVLGAIFSLWDELKTAKTWEEVEQVVWEELNNYKGFPGSSSSSAFLSSLEPKTSTIL